MVRNLGDLFLTEFGMVNKDDSDISFRRWERGTARGMTLRGAVGAPWVHSFFIEFYLKHDI